MLAEVNNALKVLLYDFGRIDPDEVDITFKMPTKEWVESLVVPTINLYQFDIEENTELRRSGVETIKRNGVAITRLPPRRFDMQYMVTPISTVLEDQGLLLWRVLATLMRFTPLPLEVLPGRLIGTMVRSVPLPSEVLTEEIQTALASEAPIPVPLLAELRPHLETRLLPVSARVGKMEGNTRALDLWGALEVPPRPSLIYSVTVPMDLEFATEAPLVLSRTLRYRRTSSEDEREARGIDRERATLIGEAFSVGGVVRDRQGTPLAGITIGIDGHAAEEVLTNREGQYGFKRIERGSIQLRVVRPGAPPRVFPVTVPSDTYDITLD